MPIGKARTIRRSAADVKHRCPRIMTTLVSSTDFREPQNNPAKIDLALKTLDLARQQQIDLLILPAGFITVQKETEILPTIRPIIRIAQKYDVSLIIGADLQSVRRCRGSDGGRMLEYVTLGQIPIFCCIFNAATGRTQIHRQRSSTPFQARQKIVPDEIMKPRIFTIGKTAFQTAICGEIFDPRLMNEAAPRIILCPTHTALPRSTRTLMAKGRRGFSVILSEHRVCRDGRLPCNDRGTDKSQKATVRVEGDNDLWLEAALWAVTDKGRIRPVQPE